MYLKNIIMKGIHSPGTQCGMVVTNVLGQSMSPISRGWAATNQCFVTSQKRVEPSFGFVCNCILWRGCCYQCKTWWW